jgi:hypothetical protein
MVSSWTLFFSYQDDARSNTHQISQDNINSEKCLYRRHKGDSGFAPVQEEHTLG